MRITEEQKRRYNAFWDRTPTDRACLYLASWDGAPAFRAPVDAHQLWEDNDYKEARAVYEIEHLRFYAEGFPTVFTNFGPGNLSACIGGGYRPSMQTVWFESDPPFVEDWATRKKVQLDRSAPAYRLVEDLSERLLSHEDAFFTSICDIGGTYDIIAALRGTENLLYDLYDEPEEIKAFRDEIAPLWKTYFLEQSDRLLKKQGCVTSWMPIWSDKAYFPLQCDFSAMLSPQMFEEFILPDLKEQTEWMEHSIYHMDGIGEIPHLDHLLSLPRLNAIQWVSGAGKASINDPCWYEMYHKIQNAGKGLILLGVPHEGLEDLLRNISPVGLYLDINVRDEKDASEIIHMASALASEQKG